jgi:hypothetical protein
MKKTVWRYGRFSMIVTLLLLIIGYLIFNKDTDFSSRELLGYGSIILALLFVFAGIKYYRDTINEGQLRFGQGIKLGMLITLFPALAFGLFSALYVTVIDPGFADTYYQWQVQHLKQTLPAAEFAAQLKEMEKYKAWGNNPFFQFLVMFLTVVAIGLIITVLSTFILRRNKPTAQIA